MKSPAWLAASALLLAPLLRAELLSPAWVELGDQGKAFVRVVVAAPKDCPIAEVDGVRRPMSLREPVPHGLRPVCELAIPTDAKLAAVNGQPLALPRPNPARIVVIGDTGCRIKGPRIQDCNDPAKWPLQRVAARSATEKPDLIIHVGDFLYREDACPSNLESVCGTTLPGDRWEAWNADFFAPAAALLAAAPWAIARGNHETCSRSWRGWFYYLDPHPWSAGSCQMYPPPYLVQLGNLQLVMLDTSAANDSKVDEKQVAIYAAQLASIHATNAWLVDHHPFWGLAAAFATGTTGPMTATLEEAWDRASPQGIKLVVSGHTHLFELLSFDGDRPPQLVAGDSGTDLAVALPESLNGTRIHGASIISSASRHAFGYTLLTKTEAGWNLELKDPMAGVMVTCSIRGNHTDCHK